MVELIVLALVGGFGALVISALVAVLRTARHAREIGVLRAELAELGRAQQELRAALAARPEAAAMREAAAAVLAEPAAAVPAVREAAAAVATGPAATVPAVPPVEAAVLQPLEPAVAAGEAGPLAAAAAASPLAPAAALPLPPAAQALPSQAAAAPADAAAPQPPARPPSELVARLRGWIFGGNTIVKAGVAILFVGLSFLAKYASEHVQVPVELRLAGIGAVALALLALGWRLRERRAQYAQVLQGGAIAVLYLTLFAAFKFYTVLPAGAAFALMALVALLAAALAVLQDARSLAVIGALGGFATPLLTSTGGGSHIALFGYYLVLDLGIAAVAWFKTWRALNLVGFAATFLVGGAWGAQAYAPEHYASTQAFLIAFFLLFAAIGLLPARRLEAQVAGDRWVNGSLLFGLPTVAFALQVALVRDTEWGVALSALAFAAFYVALAAALRGRPRLALPFEAMLAIGTVFLTLVIPFALDARATGGAWALEGAGLVWLGWRQARRVPRMFGIALVLLGSLTLAGSGGPERLVDAWLLAGAMVVVGSLAAALFTARHAPRDGTGRWDRAERWIEPAGLAWGTLWLAVVIASEVLEFVAWPWRAAALLAAFSAAAAVYALLSLRLRWPLLARPTIAHAPLMALAVALWAVDYGSLLEHGGGWAWPAALAVHALLLQRAAPQWPQPARDFVHALGALVVAGLGAVQGRAVTEGWGDADSAWGWLGWLVLPALLLAVLPRPAAALRWPVRAAPRAYATYAGAVLAAGALAWVLLANLASDGAAQPLPHLPLVNPLDLGIGCAFAAVLLWLRSPASDGWRGPAALRAALLGGLALLWFSAMLVRAFHHWGGVPYEFDAWSESLPVQTGLTLLWTSLALVLMGWSARRGASMLALAGSARHGWMAGAGLLAVVVLKLLLVDLSGSGSVTRIVSFIGVGVLMLVIGYVAPLPGREASHA